MGNSTDRYGRFVAALRAELEQERLGGRPPDLGRPDQPPASPRRLPIVWATVAAVLLVIGIASYPTIGALRTRRLIRADNREFVDTLFERTLFDTVNASETPLRESGWFDTDEITASLRI